MGTSSDDGLTFDKHKLNTAEAKQAKGRKVRHNDR